MVYHDHGTPKGDIMSHQASDHQASDAAMAHNRMATNRTRRIYFDEITALRDDRVAPFEGPTGGAYFVNPADPDQDARMLDAFGNYMQHLGDAWGDVTRAITFALTDYGVTAEITHTGGGCTTLYIGTRTDRGVDLDRPHLAMLADPDPSPDLLRDEDTATMGYYPSHEASFQGLGEQCNVADFLPDWGDDPTLQAYAHAVTLAAAHLLDKHLPDQVTIDLAWAVARYIDCAVDRLGHEVVDELRGVYGNDRTDGLYLDQVFDLAFPFDEMWDSDLTTAEWQADLDRLLRAVHEALAAGRRYYHPKGDK